MKKAVIGVAVAGITCAGVLLAHADDGASQPAAGKPAASGQAQEKNVSNELTIDAKGAELLKKDLGVWDCQVTLWLRPGAEPIKSSCTMTSKLVLEGMYREDKIEGGTLGLALGNKAWSSASYSTYDPGAKQINVVRMSSTSPAIMMERGGLNSDGHLEVKGEYTIMGMKATNRDVTIQVGPGEQRIETYMSFAGSPEFKGAEMILKLKK